MQTIKTGVVVALLLAVCYGAFVALNSPEPDLPDELLSEFDWNPDEAGLDGLMDIELPTGGAMSSLDVTTPTTLPGSTDILAGGGLATLQAPPATLPSLPGVDMPNTAGPLSSLTTPPLDKMVINLATQPGGSLPPLPTANSSGLNAADGPAVSLPGALSGISIPTEPKLPASSAAVLPSLGNQATPPPGQLVSQSRTVSAGGSDIQLPLLNNPATTTGDKENSGRQQPTVPFTVAREQALELASSDKLRDALQMLSSYYHSPELNSTQHADLVDLLDALSREVIYSPRHLAESPYTVSANDTVEGLAAKYQISPELFVAINRLGDAKTLVNGSQVKVLPGPFRAEVSLERQELTLFMGELYAGRFPVSFGQDPSPVEGTFEIVDRRRNRTYYGTGGKVIAAGDSRNPYGGFWLNLGQDLCIHGTPEMESDELQDAGCISLAPLDAADVYNILAQSSQVTIVR